MPAVQAIDSRPAPSGNWAHLLLMNDDSTLRSAYREVAEDLGFAVQVVDSPEQGAKLLEQQRAEVALIDLSLPEGELIDLVRDLKERRPEAEVIVMSNAATVSSAVQAMRLGAFEYVTKPFDARELRQLLERLASHLKMTSESRMLRENLRTRQGFGNIIGRSPEMEKLYRMISKAAYSTHPVLILGESGTGKELVARSIHYSGPHSDKPFIPVDCGSLVPTLIESELFGYVRGAFTGANRSKEGLLAIANGGTVFLDEVGELPVDLQAKLLRTLQEKEIRPVGSTHTIKVDVRILAATNRDLEVAVQSGAFRKDLFYRLNVLSLRIPSLRERRQDIPMLADFFLEKLVRSGASAHQISDQAMELLMQYDWPGNVRELENCLDRACAMSSGPGLHIGDLPSPVRNARRPGTAAAIEEAENGRIVNMAELEKRAIFAALDQLHGDKLLAARMLGIGKTTLYRKLKEYGVQ